VVYDLHGMKIGKINHLIGEKSSAVCSGWWNLSDLAPFRYVERQLRSQQINAGE
jgi:hypothetical protein